MGGRAGGWLACWVGTWAGGWVGGCAGLAATLLGPAGLLCWEGNRGRLGAHGAAEGGDLRAGWVGGLVRKPGVPFQAGALD